MKPIASKHCLLKFDPNRLNLYLKQLLDVNKIIDAVNGFMKLRKIETGGIERRLRIGCVYTLHSAFHAHTRCIAYRMSWYNFKTKIAASERKLSQISVETVINCNSMESSIKIIEMFGNIPQQPIIHEQTLPQIHGMIKRIQMKFATVPSLFCGNSHGFDWISTEAVCINCVHTS